MRNVKKIEIICETSSVGVFVPYETHVYEMWLRCFGISSFSESLWYASNALRISNLLLCMRVEHEVKHNNNNKMRVDTIHCVLLNHEVNIESRSKRSDWNKYSQSD